MNTELQTSVVVCTLNRPLDVVRLLNSLSAQTKRPARVVVVDQSNDTRTKDIVEEWAKTNSAVPVRYVRGEFKALTKGRNLGLKNVETPVTTFLDDDVEIGNDYLERILKFFTEKKGLVLGGFAWNPGQTERKLQGPGKLWTLYRKLFFLGAPASSEAQAWKVLPGFDISYSPGAITQPVQSEWISGSNFSADTATAKQIGFDENLLGYSIGEDLDFPLRVNRHRPGSVFLDPSLPIIHNASSTARLDNERLLMMHACHQYYLFFKHWPRDPQKSAKFWWSRVGTVLMPSLQVRVGGILPNPALLARALKVEAKVLAALPQVKKGRFLYRL